MRNTNHDYCLTNASAQNRGGCKELGEGGLMRMRGKPWLIGLLLAMVIGLVPGMAIAEDAVGGSRAPLT